MFMIVQLFVVICELFNYFILLRPYKWICVNLPQWTFFEMVGRFAAKF